MPITHRVRRDRWGTVWERRGNRYWHRLVYLAYGLVLLCGLIALLLRPWTLIGRFTSSPARQGHPSVLLAGLPTWVVNTGTTPEQTGGADWAAHGVAVAPAFAPYYAAHAGSQLLGHALTPAFPSAGGLIQVFANGALFLPSPTQGERASAPTGPLATAEAAAGIMADRGADVGVMLLPLMQGLLAQGSLAPVPGVGASLTYADLRAAARAQTLQPASTVCPAGGIFAMIAHAPTENLGHCIPAATWAYLQGSPTLPDGWQADVGAPLTEAISTTITRNGVTSTVLVQAFWSAILVTAPPPTATPTTKATPGPTGLSGGAVSIVQSGLDYLATFGPPPPLVGSPLPAWLTGQEQVASTPDGPSVMMLGQNYPLTLTDAHWIGTRLWYAVRYQTVARGASGWIPGDAMSFTAPPPGIAGASWAGVGALSPALSSYLKAQGNTIGMTVYDVTHNAYYTYNGDRPFLTGSSVKVPIMLTYLNQVEQEKRSLSADEVGLMTIMIENSDNNAAQEFYDALDDGPPIVAYLRSHGVTSFSPNTSGAFGWSIFTPTGMVRLLTLLEQGQILNTHDRTFALYLMEHVEPQEQIGVGQTAPAGATYAMKIGVVQGPDNAWNANSSGIVWAHGETYIISVYTGEQSLDNAYSMLNTTCAQVAKALT